MFCTYVNYVTVFSLLILAVTCDPLPKDQKELDDLIKEIFQIPQGPEDRVVEQSYTKPEPSTSPLPHTEAPHPQPQPTQQPHPNLSPIDDNSNEPNVSAVLLEYLPR